VHEEPVRAGPFVAALSDFLEPIVVPLEGGLPLLVVERLCGSALPLGLQEGGVLDQVEGPRPVPRAFNVSKITWALSLSSRLIETT
jgi:hypothetical protein